MVFSEYGETEECLQKAASPAKLPLFLLLFLLVNPQTSALAGEIFTSQIGFGPQDEKFAVLAVPSGTPVSLWFEVVDATGGVVFQGTPAGPSVGWIGSDRLGDTYQLDFSALTAAGQYHIQSNGFSSFPFRIDEAIYDVRAMRCLDFFAIQDAGAAVTWTSLDGTSGGHEASHLDDARQASKRDAGGGDSKLLEQSLPEGLPQHLDVSGGWYDAGDYNKYMGNTPWAVYNLLRAYEDRPSYWEALDEDGNGQADILDQAQVALDWMQKMVWTDGSVFERVFNGYGAAFDGHPESETDGIAGNHDDRPLDSDRYADITAKSSYALALAARLFPQSNPYGELAARTWEWSYVHQQTVKAREYGGGLYFGNVEVGLTLGALELLRSGESSVAGIDLMNFATAQVRTHLEAQDWNHVSSWDFQDSYALERYYEMQGSDPYLRTLILAQLENAYRDRILRQDSNAYRVTDEWFLTGWGQNDLATASALDALWIYQHSGGEEFRAYALNEIQWILGRNPFGKSWLASIRASNYTRHMHWRATAGHSIEGVLVPGATDSNGDGLPDYQDERSSYWYNEPTINQQALFIRAVALLDQVTFTGSQPPPDFPPSISIEAPSEGALLSQTVPIVATAVDDVGLAEVTWSVDSGPVRPLIQDDSDKWTASWDTIQYADGLHRITVTARDSAGQEGSSSVSVHLNNGSFPVLIVQIEATLREKGSGRGGKVQGVARILVTDQEGIPVQAATVVGHWEGSVGDTFSGTTDSDGLAFDYSDQRSKSGTVTFTVVVDDVSKQGWVYQPTQSVATDSVSKTY